MTRTRTRLLGLLALVAAAIVAVLYVKGGDPPSAAVPERGPRVEAKPRSTALEAVRGEEPTADRRREPSAEREAVERGRADLPVLVVDRATGLPLSGVPVELRPSRSASSGADGRCRFEDLESGDYELKTGSTAEVEFLADPTPVSLESGVHEEVVLRVERQWFLAGLVVEAGSERPVPGVRLTAREHDGQLSRVATSDKGGRFRSARSYAAGPVVLALSEQDIRGLMRTHGPAPELLRVDVGRDDVAHLTVPVDWIGVLHGVVLDPRDRPIAGAELRVLSGDSIYLENASLRFWGLYEPMRREGRTGRSDPEGRFELGGLPNDRTLVVVASASRFASGRSADRSPPFLATDEPLVLRLEDGGSIAGTVRDAEGELLTGVIVNALSAEIEYQPDPTRTDAQGAYRLTGLASGSTEVTALVIEDGGGRHAIASGTVDVIAGREVRLDLQAGADGVHLSGIAVDQDGRVITADRMKLSLRTRPLEPHPGEQAWGFDTPVRDDGSFDVTVPREGPYRLALLGNLAGDPWNNLDVRAPARDLRLVFPVTPTGQLVVRVLDDATGEPIGQGGIAISWERGSLGMDFSGGGRTTTVREGVYTLSVDAKGYAPASRELDLRGRMQPETVVEMRLDRGRSITGIVRDAAGQPAKGRSVVLRIGGMLQTKSLVYTGEDGRFTIASAPTKGGSVCVIDESYRTLASAEIGTGDVALTIASD